MYVETIQFLLCQLIFECCC